MKSLMSGGLGRALCGHRSLERTGRFPGQGARRERGVVQGESWGRDARLPVPVKFLSVPSRKCFDLGD